ncbi:MAG: hypothetical protein H7Z74_03785 [Anaerolineae bacterium]|nr:hypothetical protein [Gemmatimonadaceae bacterium]
MAPTITRARLGVEKRNLWRRGGGEEVMVGARTTSALSSSQIPEAYSGALRMRLDSQRVIPDRIFGH